MSAVLEWSDPPPTPPERWSAIRDELAARPGEWAKVIEGVSENRADNVTANLRRRGIKTAIRKVDGEGWSVWAMFPAEAS
jgi:hypothetical protein